VANVSQGTTITFGGTTLGEVVSLSVDGVAADTVEVTPRTTAVRAKVFSVADTDYGTISVTARGTAGMNTANVGLTGSLSIGGPGLSLSFPASIFQSLGVQVAVGELVTFSVTFKVSG